MTYREELEAMTRQDLVLHAILVWDMLPSDTDNFTNAELVEWCLGRDQEWEVRFGRGRIK